MNRRHSSLSSSHLPLPARRERTATINPWEQEEGVGLISPDEIPLLSACQQGGEGKTNKQTNKATNKHTRYAPHATKPKRRRESCITYFGLVICGCFMVCRRIICMLGSVLGDPAQRHSSSDPKDRDVRAGLRQPVWGAWGRIDEKTVNLLVLFFCLILNVV